MFRSNAGDSNAFPLDLSDQTTTRDSPLVGSLPTYVLVHGFMHSVKNPWITELKNGRCTFHIAWNYYIITHYVFLLNSFNSLINLLNELSCLHSSCQWTFFYQIIYFLCFLYARSKSKTYCVMAMDICFFYRIALKFQQHALVMLSTLTI